MRRPLITADPSRARPFLAVIAWVALLGGWLAVAAVAGLWPFAQEAALRSLQPAPPLPSVSPPAPRPADAMAPEPPDIASPSHVPGERSTLNEIEIVWSEPADPESGIAGYSYTWSELPDTTPEPVLLATSETLGMVSAALPPGAWWFHLRAVDGAGNWSVTAHLGPFLVGAATAIPRPAAAVTVAPPRTLTPVPAAAPARTVAPSVATPRSVAPAPAPVSPAATSLPSTPAGEASRPLTPQPTATR